MSNPGDTFELDVRYDDDLRDQIEAGADDPLGWVDAVVVDEQAVIGGEDAEGLKEYLNSLFGGLLQSAIEVLDGEAGVVRPGNGPVYIALEPCETDAATISLCYSKESAHSPKAREGYEPSAAVRIRPLVDGILEAATEFETCAQDVNPVLAERTAYRGLREGIERAERAYERRSRRKN